MKKKKIGTIYKHTLLLNCPESGGSYIGQTSNSVETRGKNGMAYRGQPKFFKAIVQYGGSNFSHEILVTGITSQKEADKLEKYYIKLFHTYTLDKHCQGGNATKGGTGYKSLLHGDSSKEVICLELNKTGRSAVEAAKALKVGENGICMCCKKQRKTAYGYHWSYTSDKQNLISLAMYKNKKQLTSQAKKVKCIETGIIYSCLNEAAKDIPGLSSGNSIGSCCLGKRKTAGGYHGKYIK